MDFKHNLNDEKAVENEILQVKNNSLTMDKSPEKMMPDDAVIDIDDLENNMPKKGKGKNEAADQVKDDQESSEEYDEEGFQELSKIWKAR